MLLIKNITKNFGKKLVLDDISLEVREGECFGLIGLNGVGKTTLIKIIVNLSRPDKGTILVGNKENFRIEAKQLLSFLPEVFQPPLHLTSIEFVSYMASLYGKTIERKSIFTMAERLELDPSMLKRQIKDYSKGMRQKIGLIATIIPETPLLILDEPLSGLDPKARVIFKDIILEEKEKGRTIFFSSHILSDLEEITDRIAILHSNGIQYIGQPQQLLNTAGKDSLERAFLTTIGEK